MSGLQDHRRERGIAALGDKTTADLLALANSRNTLEEARASALYALSDRINRVDADEQRAIILAAKRRFIRRNKDSIDPVHYAATACLQEVQPINYRNRVEAVAALLKERSFYHHEGHKSASRIKIILLAKDFPTRRITKMVAEYLTISDNLNRGGFSDMEFFALPLIERSPIWARALAPVLINHLDYAQLTGWAGQDRNVIAAIKGLGYDCGDDAFTRKTIVPALLQRLNNTRVTIGYGQYLGDALGAIGARKLKTAQAMMPRLIEELASKEQHNGSYPACIALAAIGIARRSLAAPTINALMEKPDDKTRKDHALAIAREQPTQAAGIVPYLTLEENFELLKAAIEYGRVGRFSKFDIAILIAVVTAGKHGVDHDALKPDVSEHIKTHRQRFPLWPIDDVLKYRFSNAAARITAKIPWVSGRIGYRMEAPAIKRGSNPQYQHTPSGHYLRFGIGGSRK